MDLFSPLVERAIELAAQWHAGTRRKGMWRSPPFLSPDGDIPQVPVASHTMAVATILLRDGWDDVTVAAALLHDVIEDGNRHGQRMTLEQLQNLMGQPVAHLVEHVSEPVMREDGSLVTWEYRKKAYIESIPHMPEAARAISMADKSHNLWSMSQCLNAGQDMFTSAPDRIGLSRGPAEQLWFYRSVQQAMYAHMTDRLTRLYDLFSDELATLETFLAGTSPRNSVGSADTNFSRTFPTDG